MATKNLSDRVKVVRALTPQSVAYNDSAVTESDLDCTGFEWAFVILDVSQGGTAIDAASSFTLTAAATAAGAPAAIEDDTYNITGGASANNTAVINTTASVSGLYYGEIDLRAHHKFIDTSFDPDPGSAGSEGAATVAAYIILSEAKDIGQSVANSLGFQILHKDKAAY